MAIPSIAVSLIRAGLLLAIVAGNAPPVAAAGVPLDAAPPDTLSAVTPNIAVTVDNSASMARGYMPDAVGAGSGLNSTNTGTGTIFQPDYYYSGVNKIYYNPDITYDPPLRPDGVTRFPNSSYTAAWRDGLCANLAVDGSQGTRCPVVNAVNLSTRFYIGFDSFDGIRDYPAGSNTSTAWRMSTRNIPAAVRTVGSTVHVGGFYYVKAAQNRLVLVSVNAQSAQQQQNFANWYSYYRTRSLMAHSSLSTVFAKRDGAIRLVWQGLHGTLLGDNTAIVPFEGQSKSDFFRWLYSESMFEGTPNRDALLRAIKFFKSGFANGLGTGTRGRFNPYWQPLPGHANGGMELTCRQNFHLLITDGYWTNNDSPTTVTPRVSQSFSLPDGRLFAPGTVDTRVYSNEARTADSNAAPSLADLAFHGWATDLRANLDNNVPQFLGDSGIGVTNATSRPIPAKPFEDSEIYFNPANDPATWQHVVNFMVGLGVAGRLNGSTPAEINATVRSMRAGGGPAWPVPTLPGEDPRKLDDTWHAAVNSRGAFLSASNPRELIDGLDNVLRAVTMDRASATAVAGVSSAFVGAGGRVYGTSYATGNWSGNLVAHRTDASGTPVGDPLWNAGGLLTARGADSRLIFTSALGRGQALRYSQLSPAQRLVLDKNPATVTGNRTRRENPVNWSNDGRGDLRVKYLRGDRSAESTPPNFRTRTSLLGAIIESQPLYVASPGGRSDTFPAGSPEHAAFLDGKSYERFVADNRARSPTVYVGANDGMVHAFDAINGQERWAYFPGTLIDNGRAARMTMPSADLVSGADDTLITSDVFINGQWRTVLVGSLRLGGRGVYAIDITSPAAANENEAAGKLLWEFSNRSDGGGKLGYTYGSANIVRLNNGKWAVVVSGGYFPTDGLDSDDPEATSGGTSLFVLDLETGRVIKEFRSPAGVTSYGLSRAGALDASQNWTTEILMAGDLAGNLFRYDVSSPNPETWSVRHFFRTYENAAGIGMQPISVMPLPMTDRASKLPIWIFGTGKFIGEPDRMAANQPTQSYYGVRDPAFGAGRASATYPILPSALQVQTLTTRGSFRTATAFEVPPDKSGWRIDMLAPGERNTLIATGLNSSNLVVLMSLIPLSDGDPCSSSRSGFLMVLDSGTGGAAVGSAGEPRVSIKDCPPGENCVAKPPVDPPPTSGAVPVGNEEGGGMLRIPGEPDIAIQSNYWHRQAWRELFNLYDSNR